MAHPVASEEAQLAIEPRARAKGLRQSAIVHGSQKVQEHSPRNSLRRSELSSASSLGQSITTMENADIEVIITAFGTVVRAYIKDWASRHDRQIPPPTSSRLFDEESYPLDGSKIWRFVPKVQTIEIFVRTIQIALELDESSLVIALILLERAMLSGERGLALSARTWRPAVLISIIIASKVVYDEKVFLADYREMLPELCLGAAAAQELELLKLVGYSTTVRRGQYAKYYYALEDVARTQAMTSSASEA